MKKTMKLFSLIAATMLIAGCNGKGGNNNNTSGNDGPNWAQDIQDEMMDLFGDVLPYAALDEESLTHEYDDSLEALGFGMYYLYDNNETNVLDGYDDLLVQAGYEYAPYVDDSGSSTDYWDKTTAKGNVSVTFGWYEASDTDPAGNSIYVSWEILYTEESLIADGYQKVTGWPAETVAATVGSGVPTVAPVNANGDWFVGTDLWTSDDGSTKCDALYLATFGDFVSDFDTGMTANNWLYDEDHLSASGKSTRYFLVIVLPLILLFVGYGFIMIYSLVKNKLAKQAEVAVNDLSDEDKERIAREYLASQGVDTDAPTEDQVEQAEETVADEAPIESAEDVVVEESAEEVSEEKKED